MCFCQKAHSNYVLSSPLIDGWLSYTFLSTFSAEYNHYITIIVSYTFFYLLPPTAIVPHTKQPPNEHTVLHSGAHPVSVNGSSPLFLLLFSFPLRLADEMRSSSPWWRNVILSSRSCRATIGLGSLRTTVDWATTRGHHCISNYSRRCAAFLHLVAPVLQACTCIKKFTKMYMRR